LVGECNARLAGNYHFAVKSDSPFLAHWIYPWLDTQHIYACRL
jgi:hypothetical protein